MRHTAISLLLLAIAVSSAIAKEDFCISKYKCGDLKNTLCTHPEPSPSASCGDLVSTNLTSAEKQKLVMIHNTIRDRVAMGSMKMLINGGDLAGAFPPASDMHRIVWSSELEELAVRWAYQCQGATHDACRKTPKYADPGQNIVDYEEPTGQILMEHWDKHFVDIPIGLLAETEKLNREEDLFVARMLFGKTMAMGCGRVVTLTGGARKSHVVCNYSHGGTLNGPTYAVGEACSACPDGRSCVPLANSTEPAGADRSWPHLCRTARRRPPNEDDSDAYLWVYIISGVLTLLCCCGVIGGLIYYFVKRNK